MTHTNLPLCFYTHYIFLRYSLCLWQSCMNVLPLSLSFSHTQNGQTLSLASQSPIKHLNAVTHSGFFFANDNIYSSGRETFHSEDPTLLCQGRSGPVNWLLLTNKAVKSSIVHLFLYANEVQTQHALSFVSSLHPPSSLSPIGGFDVKMLWQACSLSLSAAGTKDVIGAKTRKQLWDHGRVIANTYTPPSFPSHCP